jgi:hypothetical protein
VLRIECGGGGNVAEIASFLDSVGASLGQPPGSPWNFRDPGWWLDLLLSTGYTVGDAGFVRTVAQRRPFDRDSLLGWLRSQCLHGYDPSIAPTAESRIDELRRPDGSYDLTFVRLDALVHRPRVRPLPYPSIRGQDSNEAGEILSGRTVAQHSLPYVPLGPTRDRHHERSPHQGHRT